MIRVLIADDHPLARRGLRDIFEDEADITIGAEAENGQEVLKAVREGRWDVLVLDLSMPGLSGLDLLKQLKSEKPGLPVLVVTMHPEKQYAVRALRAGASGYLTKGSPPEEIIAAVRKLAAGGKYASSTLTETLVRRIDEPEDKMPHETLSDREFQVLCMVASGMTVSEIAHKLSLSVNTISTYRSRILDKMSMQNNAQLTRYAVDNQLAE